MTIPQWKKLKRRRWWKRLLEKRTWVMWYEQRTSLRWWKQHLHFQFYYRHTKGFKDELRQVREATIQHRKDVLEHPYCLKCGSKKSTQEVYCSKCKGQL